MEGLSSKVRDRRGNMHVWACAAEIGISPKTLHKIETGGLPSRPTLVKLRRWLGESESRLFQIDMLDAAKPRMLFPRDFAERIIEAAERSRGIDA